MKKLWYIIILFCYYYFNRMYLFSCYCSKINQFCFLFFINNFLMVCKIYKIMLLPSYCKIPCRYLFVCIEKRYHSQMYHCTRHPPSSNVNSHCEQQSSRCTCLIDVFIVLFCNKVEDGIYDLYCNYCNVYLCDFLLCY